MRKITFIVGLGHSGTTLLGNMLGSHSASLHVGELLAPVRKGKGLRCSLCVDDLCPVWGDKDERGAIESKVQQFLKDPQLLAPGSIHQRFFEAERHPQHLIDSSKKLQWARHNAIATDFVSRIVWLKRDLRGCLASWKRSQKRPIDETARHAKKEIAKLIEAERSGTDATWMSLDYESLVTRPDETLSDLCSFLDLDYEPSMKRANETLHHLAGGNPGPALQSARHAGASTAGIEISDQQRKWYEASTQLAVDDRYKTELTPSDLKIFSTILAEENRALGYA